MPGILGRKIGMTRIFDQQEGFAVPLTLIHCTPNVVHRLKTKEKDKYEAVVLGFEPLKRPKKTRKFRVLKEFSWQGEMPKPGDQVSVEIFKEAKEVAVTGVSKGKGFQGTIKRWHMHSGPGSHGSHFHREPGSVGGRARPGKLHKGKHLAGHMGGDTVTLKKVPVVKIDTEHNLLALKGAVPGPKGGLVMIRV